MSTFEFALAGASGVVAYAFPSSRFTIGSAPSSGLRFDESLVQPQHAEIALDAKGVPWVRDLTNQRQVMVNGVPTDRAALAVGATITLGKLVLHLRQRVAAEASVEVTARRPTPFASPPVRASGPHQALALDTTARHPSPFASPGIDSTAKRPTPFRSMPVGGKASSSQWLPVLTPQPIEGIASGDEETRRAPIPQPPKDAEALGPDRTVLPEGAVIGGRYRIIKKLAAGGMGEVYQAEHVELHKLFAVKVMLPALSSDPEFVNRFKREAISASRIGQLNIIDISDFGQTEDDGRFYFVMEFLDGITIASLLHRQGGLDLTRMVNISVQVARALAAAHAQGIVHRDMKPENIMVLQRPGQPDFVKVLDFGVAKVSKGPGEGGQTQLGMVVGTPQYMSPEQAMGVAVDARTDTYALGLIFYEMLTGAATFQGETASILMVKQVTEPAPPFPSSLVSTLPAALSDLIFQMLEKDPKLRPFNMDRVVDVLEDLQARLRVGAPVPLATASGRFPSTATPQTLSPVRISSAGLPVVPAATAVAPVLAPTSQAPAVEAPKSKAPLVLGAVAVLAVLGGGGFLAFKPAPVDAPKEPVVVTPPVPTITTLEKVDDKPPPPVQLSFTLESVPPGAQVFRGDSLLGMTPLTLEVEKGQDLAVELRLAGYANEAVKLAPVANGQRLELPLKKLAGPKTGPTKPKIDKPKTPPNLEPYDPYSSP